MRKNWSAAGFTLLGLFWVLLVTVYAEPLGQNISGTPALASAKAKMDNMPIYVPTQDADGVVTADSKSQPTVVTYSDDVAGTGAADVFAAVSRDDGLTWNITNLSQSAEKSSFTLKNGTPYPGDSRKPVLTIKGNKLFVAWTSKYAPNDIPDTYFAEDLFGVRGDQRSIDYTYAYKGEYAWAGEIPYSAVWTARGLINTTTGAITWQPAQQLTSAVRDALQVASASALNTGFAVSWQEDPEGLLPGSGDGPGHGWSGAIANHKTDIWYSYIGWTAFDVPTNRLSLPVRITDNDLCRPQATTVINPETFGQSNRYGWLFKNTEELTAYCEQLVYGFINYDAGSGDDPEYVSTHQYCTGVCDSTATILNEQGELNQVCVTADGRLLDGRQAATRPNIFLQPYTRSDSVKSAWVILGYEESKGYSEPGLFDEGKNVIYHSFDMMQPETISGGHILNLPEVASDNSLVGGYENARRIRFILQPASKMGTARTPLIAIYKQGRFGTGSPSDIFLRRFVVPTTDTSYDNPYRFENIQAGALNMSSFSPSGPYTVDQEHPEDGVKVPGMIQTEGNLHDQSYANPFSEARAHRGQIRGNNVVLGYAQTINWQAAANGRDNYDLYVRRSFDGGQTWTDAEGNFEMSRNLSNLPDNSYSVVEPRIVSTPGTVKNLDGTATGNPEDVENPQVYMVTYGTEVNDAGDEGKAPADLFYARTTDFGESYELVDGPDGTKSQFEILAGGASEQGEAQIRLSPAGNLFYSVWLGEQEISGDPAQAEAEGSDIRFRRIDLTTPSTEE